MAVAGPTYRGWKFDPGNSRLDKYYNGTRIGHINATGETVVGTFSTSGAFTVDAGGLTITSGDLSVVAGDAFVRNGQGAVVGHTAQITFNTLIPQLQVFGTF